jgi:hypothetical protein
MLESDANNIIKIQLHSKVKNTRKNIIKVRNRIRIRDRDYFYDYDYDCDCDSLVKS